MLLSDENKKGSSVLYEDPTSGKVYKKSGEMWVEVLDTDEDNRTSECNNSD